MIKRQKKRKLTKQQEKFVDLMARGYHEGRDPTKMTVMDAFRLAGYAPDNGNAYRLYKDLKEIIKEKRDDLVDENQVASLATKIIEDIMVNPDVRPEIRLKAAQDFCTEQVMINLKKLILTKQYQSFLMRNLMNNYPS